MSRFVVLEGIDGAGTTTQAKRLVDALVARGRDAHLTREPSTGPVGALLREMLGGAHQPVDDTTLALLFAADRADHLQREIRPALARGAVVVCDRYVWSSLAYQAVKGAGDRPWIEQLNGRARDADLTILLDVPPDVAAARRAADGRPDELFDRMDTQRRVADAYRQIAAERRGRERVEVLDGTRPLDEVAAAVLAAVESCLAAPARAG